MTVLPLAARAGREADLFLLRARKGDRGPFRLRAPCVLHSGVAHVQGVPDFAPAIAAALREGAALDWGD